MSGVLSDKFDFPPVSILNATGKKWQLRKQAWLARGISSGEGRDDDLLRFSATVRKGTSGTSIFDPVLCELMYKWFAKPNGQVIDPFAGGSVRGIVAGWRNLDYWGCDLSEKQIKANREQADVIKENFPDELRKMPKWVVGDSTVKLDEAPDADFILSCPPYYDLEVYSDDRLDLSNMPDPDFLKTYREIVRKSVAKLRDNSFACFVVGDTRDNRGIARNFINQTVDAFTDAGARLYDEAILRTPIGSSALRAEGTFKYRKFTKVHQHVLIFCKGDPKEAAAKNKG